MRTHQKDQNHKQQQDDSAKKQLLEEKLIELYDIYLVEESTAARQCVADEIHNVEVRLSMLNKSRKLPATSGIQEFSTINMLGYVNRG